MDHDQLIELTRRALRLARDQTTEPIRGAAGSQAVFEYAHATVRDEDYRLVEGLQANLESGARNHLRFGRNEPGLQHRHITWAQAPAGAPSAV